MKIISEFLSENFQFLVVKSSVYLNRRVFVMLLDGSLYDVQSMKRALIQFADNVGSDQHAHRCSQIRAFSVH